MSICLILKKNPPPKCSERGYPKNRLLLGLVGEKKIKNGMLKKTRLFIMLKLGSSGPDHSALLVDSKIVQVQNINEIHRQRWYILLSGMWVGAKEKKGWEAWKLVCETSVLKIGCWNRFLKKIGDVKLVRCPSASHHAFVLSNVPFMLTGFFIDNFK